MRFVPSFLRRSGSRGVPVGQRLYAIGDIHGRMDLLSSLLGQIGEDDQQRGVANTRIIVLGDFIDRGPSSAAVIEFLQQAQSSGKPLTVLLGNHEAALLECLQGNIDLCSRWLRFGGDATCLSLGLELPAKANQNSEFIRQVQARLSAGTIEWLKSLPVSFRSGGYFFCHAGVRPGVPLAWQETDDMIWGVDSFLSSKRDHGAIVVHGHSICGDKAELLPNRICVDTGAYQSGILSAVGLEGEDVWTLAAAGKPIISQLDSEDRVHSKSSL
jgi:serine/threonine protein phosphatase 1